MLSSNDWGVVLGHKREPTFSWTLHTEVPTKPYEKHSSEHERFSNQGAVFQIVAEDGQTELYEGAGPEETRFQARASNLSKQDVTSQWVDAHGKLKPELDRIDGLRRDNRIVQTDFDAANLVKRPPRAHSHLVHPSELDLAILTHNGTYTESTEQNATCPMGYVASNAVTATVLLPSFTFIFLGLRPESIVGARRYINFSAMIQTLIFTMVIPDSLKLTRLLGGDAATSGWLISAQMGGLGLGSLLVAESLSLS